MLAEALWDSVAKHDAEIELTEKQKLELDKRIANYEVDCDTGSSWSEVRERIIAKK